MRSVTSSVTFFLFLSANALLAHSQLAPQPLSKVAQAAQIETEPITTFYLANTSQPNDANEIVTALRNMVSTYDRVYLVPSRNAIVMRALPEDIQIARKLIADLDRPHKTYRLTYTVSEMDSGKRIGLQHFSMVVAAGAKTELREGSRVPLVTGSYTGSTTGAQSQVTYIDVGLNISAALDQSTDGLNLRSKIEQSSIAEEKSGLGTSDPLIRQSVLEGTASMTLAKPLSLGSLDIPGSTRHLDIEVILDLIR
jgi:type II secretory pathway component GspD/PulD (secretin)